MRTRPGTGIRRLRRAAYGLLLVATVSCRSAAPDGNQAAATPMPIIPRRGEIVIAAWTEPRYLPKGGGQVQVLVRVQRVGGGPYPGVQVQLHSTTGQLATAGKALVTDTQGMTRDRLTATPPVGLIVQSGDTRYRFQVTTRPEPEP
jgi:hypothetical protein